jgi:hypothetical protein
MTLPSDPTAGTVVPPAVTDVSISSYNAKHRRMPMTSEVYMTSIMEFCSSYRTNISWRQDSCLECERNIESVVYEG